jgi:hypothetical protein
MRQQCLLLSGCVLAVLVTVPVLAQPDPPGQPPPFVGSPPPEELQVLAPLVGTWTVKSVGRPSVPNQDGFTATGEMTGQWLHNRQFLRLESKLAGSKYREEFTILYTYDTRKKVYRRWLFSSSGLATEAEGQWDERSRTMHWKPLHLSANVTGSVTEVLTPDRFESTVFFKRNDGQVLTDLTATATRKKAPNQ